MKNLTVRPEFSASYDEQRYPPEPPKDVVRFAGESFTAMKAMQDEYGRKIPATYAEKNAVDALKAEVRTLSDNIAETYARADELAKYVKRDEINAKVNKLEFANEIDILKIFRWGRA